MKENIKTFFVISMLFSFLFASCSNIINDLNNLKNYKPAEPELPAEPEEPETPEVPEVPDEPEDPEPVIPVEPDVLVLLEEPDGEYKIFSGTEIPEGFEFDKEESEENTISKFYRRKTVILTFDCGRGERTDDNFLCDTATWKDSDDFAPKEIRGKYGTPVDLSLVPEVESNDDDDRYQFAGWNIQGETEILSFPVKDTAYTALWVFPYVEYKVRTYLQKENGEDYDLASTSEVKYGQEGTTTQLKEVYSLPENAKIGFDLKKVDEVELVKDGTEKFVDVYYNRKAIKVTFDPKGGKWKDGIKKDTGDVLEISGFFGINIPYNSENSFVEDPVRENFKFLGWKYSTAQAQDKPEKFWPSDTTFIADWEQVNSTYTVKHLFQKVDDNSVYEEDESLRESVTVPVLITETEAAAKTVKGYHSKSFDQEEIDLGGFTVIEIKYDLNNVTVTYVLNGGVWAPDSKWSDKADSNRELKGKCFVPLEQPAEVIRPGYDFAGWKLRNKAEDESNEIPLTFPATDSTSASIYYDAQWDLAGLKYKVLHRFQDLDDTSSYSEKDGIEDELLPGFIDQDTNAQPVNPVPEGFEIEEIETKSISAEETVSVTVKYRRKKYTMSFDPNGGILVGGDYDESKDKAVFAGKLYETPATGVIPVRAEWDKFHVFKGWSLAGDEDKSLVAVPEKFTVNAEYVAVWEEIPSTDTSEGMVVTTGDLAVSYENGYFAVSHELDSLVFDYVELDGVEITPVSSGVVKTTEGSVTTYKFEKAVASGRYSLKVYMSDSKNPLLEYSKIIELEIN